MTTITKQALNASRSKAARREAREPQRKPMTWHDLLRHIAAMPHNELNQTAFIAADDALVTIVKVTRAVTHDGGKCQVGYGPFVLEPQWDLKRSLPEVDAETQAIRDSEAQGDADFQRRYGAV